MIAINKTTFSKAEDFTPGLLEVDVTSPDFPSGGIPLYTQGNKAYLDTSDSHSIVFGATGSKKTRLFVMPSVEFLYRSNESFLVTDPKGEIYQKTKNSAKIHNYRTICLDLRNIKSGNSWNPLQLPYELYHSGNKTKALEMLSELSSHIIGDAGELFWTNTGVDMLLGFMLLLVLNNTKEACTIRNLVGLWNHYSSDQRVFSENLRRGEFITDELITSKLHMLYNKSDKTVGSAEAIVATGLNRLIINDDLMDFLSTNNFNLYEMANKKVGIYLIIPDENTSSHFVASLFISQLYEVLIQVAQKSKNNALDVRMNFVIDEFANLPKLNNVDSMITASRSRNIRFTLIVQGLTQLKHKYDELANTLCGNCNNWIYLYSKDYELLHTISNLCGEVIYDDHTRIPLMSEFDLQHLSKENGEVLVLSGRKLPFLSHLTDIDDYPFYREPADPEPEQSEPGPTGREPERADREPGANRVGRSFGNSYEIRPKVSTIPLPPTLSLRKPQPAVAQPSKTLFSVMSKGKTSSANYWAFSSKPKRWLIATLDHVIIADALIPEDELSSPDIYETIINHFKGNILGDYLLRSYIKFYHADIKYQNEYADYLSKHPEVVYLECSELGPRTDFTRILANTEE